MIDINVIERYRSYQCGEVFKPPYTNFKRTYIYTFDFDDYIANVE